MQVIHKRKGKNEKKIVPDMIIEANHTSLPPPPQKKGFDVTNTYEFQLHQKISSKCYSAKTLENNYRISNPQILHIVILFLGVASWW